MLAGLAQTAVVLAQGSTVQPAVLWERAKDSAPPRQTRAVKPEVQRSGAAETTKTEDPKVDEALRWERAKDRAAERQMQKDATRQGASSAKNKKK
jgi:hypothetical protein